MKCKRITRHGGLLMLEYYGEDFLNEAACWLATRRLHRGDVAGEVSFES